MRIKILALFCFLFTACSASHSPPALPSDSRFQEIQAQAVQLEKETATRLLELDRRISKPAIIDKRAKKTPEPFPAEEERQLYLSEVNLNGALDAAYAQAWQRKTGDAELQTALLHWTVLLRRALMRDFHTRVPGLENDPDCAGDIVGDGMLWRYFEAVLAHHEVNAALALADLARQSACLSVSQSEFLATVLVDTFNELRAFLRLSGHEDLVPYVVQAGSAPLLLFYDVEKYRGSDSPLAAWFRENRDILIEGVESGRQPSRWHGLWLYDRRTGRLFGFKATPKPVDENDVNLARFYASITTLENLGDARCSFAEMVERGMGVHGYFCAGASCGRPASGRVAGRKGRVPSRAPFGLSGIEKTFDRAICGEGRDGPGEQSAGPKCGEDPGHNRGADTVRCLTQQVVHAGTEGFQCFGEAAGRCGTPVEGLVKGTRLQEYAGIKIGPDCALASGKKPAKGPKLTPEQQTKKDQEERYKTILELDEAIAEISMEIKLLQMNMERAGDEANRDFLAYEKEKKAAVADGRDPATDPKVMAALAKAQQSSAADAKNRAEQQDKLVAAEMKKAKAEKALKERIEEDAKKLEEERKAAEKKAEEKKKADQQKAKDGGTKHCVQDDPNCGGDLCTGMSQAARETMACVQAALSQQEAVTRDPSGGCDPRTCDPIEPNPNAPGTLACFDAMGKDPATVIAKHCWATRCVHGQVPVSGASGCTCREGGGQISPTAGVNNFCTKMLCSEGTPTFQDGHCVCSGSGAKFSKENFGGYGGPSPKQLPPVFSQPATYSEIRYGPPF